MFLKQKFCVSRMGAGLGAPCCYGVALAFIRVHGTTAYGVQPNAVSDCEIVRIDRFHDCNVSCGVSSGPHNQAGGLAQASLGRLFTAQGLTSSSVFRTHPEPLKPTKR